jgi:predicted house-cleaning noncanonical NTP pyrophosphatase (MazG superfamily)
VTEQTGVKAAGLDALTESWTPPYVVIPSMVAARVSASASGNPSRLARALKGSPVGAPLARLFAASSEGVIVRSSAPEEGMTHRGLYRSVEAYGSFPTVAEAMLRVWRHASAVTGREGAIPLIVQTLVPPQLLGHLSNERRLREDRRDWVVQIDGPLSGTQTSGLRAVRDGMPLEAVDPTCASPADLRAVLRSIAGALTRTGTRFHLEWVWDGARVWLVQCDPVPEVRGELPVVPAPLAPLGGLQAFRALAEQDRALPKVRCVLDYMSLDLPHADIRVLAGEEIVRELRDGRCRAALAADLEILASRRAVVRTDIANRTDFEVMLPRTDAALDAPALRGFMHDAAARLAARGIPLRDIAFLAHAFIPAEAGAWALAAPKSSQVRVDATFGIPDGLLYYPHDSWELDVRNARVVDRRLRCKSHVLVAGVDGRWTDRELGAPWDWRSAITRDEALEIASMTKQLADHLGHPIEVMYFVRAEAGTHVVALPWVHRTAERGARGSVATASYFPSRSVLVRGPQDLRILRDALYETLREDGRLLVRLEPDAGVLHESRFLEELKGLCATGECSVQLAGSTLSHVYYEMVRAGVSLEVIDPMSSSARPPVSFDKLVRTLIPEAIAAKGERVRTYRASGRDLERLLKEKLLEEAFEVAGATSTNDVLAEIGDVLDVIAALCTVSGTDLASVFTWAQQKRKERGGFEEGIVLVDTREPSLAEALEDADTYTVPEDVGTQVERRRRRARSAVPIDVGDEAIDLPYRIPSDTAREPFRLLIGGREYEVRFTTRGIRISAAAKLPQRNQLSLDLS